MRLNMKEKIRVNSASQALDGGGWQKCERELR